MHKTLLRAAVAGALLAAPGAALACACGCGVFDVGAGAMASIDSTARLTAWFRYDYMDQNQNWEGAAKAPAADNGDQKLETSFYTVGADYMINRRWTIMAELPIFDRALTTTDDGTVYGPAGSVYTAHDTAIGDLQLTAVYTGLSPDKSTGIGLGVKLATGDFKGPTGTLGGQAFDRDSLPGTGSTDLMLSAYHVGRVTRDGKLGWFAQARYQFAVATRDQYRPGNELDSAAGVTWNLGRVGPANRVAPVLQLVDSWREHDTGDQADYLNSGYERLLIAPGVDIRINRVRLYGDVEIPVYQHTNAAPSVDIEGTSGQLVASVLYKLTVSYDF